MIGYRCSECGRPIGLIADNRGRPQLFKCPHSGRVAELQKPIKRDTPKPSMAARVDVLRQLRIQTNGHHEET